MGVRKVDRVCGREVDVFILYSLVLILTEVVLLFWIDFTILVYK